MSYLASRAPRAPPTNNTCEQNKGDTKKGLGSSNVTRTSTTSNLDVFNLFLLQFRIHEREPMVADGQQRARRRPQARIASVFLE
jgi:hypothetical protein